MRYLISILVILSLSACAIEREVFLKGEELCKNNGGLEMIWYDSDVICNNGAIFDKIYVNEYVLKDDYKLKGKQSEIKR